MPKEFVYPIQADFILNHGKRLKKFPNQKKIFFSQPEKKTLLTNARGQKGICAVIIL